MIISEGSIDYYQLTGLENDETYNLSIAATSLNLQSTLVELQVELSKLVYVHMRVYFPQFSPSSRGGVGEGELHNSQLHLPLLECC